MIHLGNIRIHPRSFKKSRCLHRPPDPLIQPLGVPLGYHHIFVFPGDYNRNQSCNPCSVVGGEILATFPRWRLPGRFRFDVRRQGAGFPGAHARSVSSPREPSSFPPRLHFVRGRWGQWEQIYFRVGKRGGGGEKGSSPGGGRAERDQVGEEAAAEGLLPEPLWPGRKGAGGAGSVAEMTCGPEWEGEPGEGRWGVASRGRGALEEGPGGERGGLGAGPGAGGRGRGGGRGPAGAGAWESSRGEWSGIVGRALTAKMGRAVIERQELGGILSSGRGTR